MLEEDGPGQAEDLLGGRDAVEGVDVAVLGRVLVLLALESVAADHVALRRRLKVGQLVSLYQQEPYIVKPNFKQHGIKNRHEATKVYERTL